jgi:hypothetical protein
MIIYLKKNPEVANRDAELYYLALPDVNLYKIGITTNLNRRIQNLGNAFGKVELKFSRDGKLSDVYHIEQEILSFFKDKRTFRKQSTELFSADISIEEEFEKIFFR